ncbi:prepilin-type N-terminal cleavage/methylation domain-containing protein [Psychrobacter cryohalolentis]|uniref:pilus assembly FimT family protein n=1 Tax=Psychrobacter sp. D2 TaxID=2759702 RepID=UPI0015E5A2E0|nr:prepilin-type N-terminal cleavage/methylation domain-containing protein [Psychrobacter sp. D2]MBA2056625.1 prepilin-type N-terminal cleavage/methylation domain-containing protein [Psychrobacter sp. D2]
MKASANNRPQKLRRSSSGFTLIELMVAIAVLAIIVSIAAPSISTQLANQRVKSTAAILQNALKEARVESVVRRQEIEVSYDDSSHNIMIKVDDGSNNDEIATYQYNAKSIIDGDDDIKFKPNKTADDETYAICDSNEAATPRTITVSKLGAVSIQLGGSC